MSKTKSYAILRYTEDIMAHLQVCKECSEYVFAHVYPEKGMQKPREKQERL